MVDTLSQIKSLIGGKKQEEARTLLSKTYGYSPQLSNVIVDTLGGQMGEDRLRELWYESTRKDKGSPYYFGTQENISKEFGGFQGLAEYLTKGGGLATKELPKTQAGEGWTGGYAVQTPTEQITPQTLAAGGITPTTPRTQYADLMYRTIPGQEQKEVYNPTTGKVYGTPEQLATDLGLAPGVAPDWTKIGVGGVGVGAGIGAGAGGGTTGGETLGAGVGTEVKTSENPYLQAIMDFIKKKEGEPTESEQYTKYREQLGIPGMETTQTGIQKQVSDVENLLDKLEGDIASRSQGKLVTMAQQRRYQAVEERPLREQYTELLKAGTTTGTQLSSAREELARLMGLETEADRTAKLLPFLKELATYESPSDEAKRKLAEMIAEEEAQKKAGVAEYYQKPTEQWSDPYQLGGDWVQKNKTTGEIRTAVNVPAGEGGGGTTTLATTLYNVGLNSTMVDNKGKLTESNLAKLGKAGIPPSLADEIMSFIVKGQTLEEIRGILATRFGKDKGFKHLDDFMQTLQRKGVSGGGADDFFNSL